MYQGQIRATVALLVLMGHLAVFVAGFLLGIFGPLNGSDTAQTVLIASPVLGATASAALKWVVRGEFGVEKGQKVGYLFSFVVAFFPTMLLASIFFVFFAVYKQVNGFGPDQMKTALGGIETFFGVFLGTISDTLFGKDEPHGQRGPGGSHP